MILVVWDDQPSAKKEAGYNIDDSMCDAFVKDFEHGQDARVLYHDTDRNEERHTNKT